MADLDFGAPSFSLGLDLDLDSEPATSPPKESLPKSAEQSSINANFRAFEDDAGEDFQLQEDPDPDPPRVLKRLRKRLRTPSPPPCSRKESAQLFNPEDDIEEFSSQEDRRKEEHRSRQNHSACSSSKFSLHSQRILNTQSASKLKTQESTPASGASTFGGLEGINNQGKLPELTSPLRKIQLLDSDSDDPPSSEDQPENCKNVCAKGKQCSSTQAVAGNQQNIAKVPSNKVQTESLWTDFGPKKNTKFATPAFDEFCEEYFSSMKEKDVDQRKKRDFGSSSSRSLSHGQFLEEIDGCFQEKSIHGNSEHYVNHLDPHPPAYRYFYHNDPRIQKLVRDRLPNFFPVGAVSHKRNGHSETTVLDYMSQFGHRDAPTEVDGTSSRGHEGSSRAKRSRKNANAMASQASEGWVNPKSSATIPRDAGKRRVSADSHSAGHWYTSQDGRKVYVTKNGQEMTGQSAYRHYRKESGVGFRRSRKKAASKKKKKKASPKKKARR